VALWLSGNALASINIVLLRQTWLVPSWVSQHVATQVDLAFYLPWDGKMSISLLCPAPVGEAGALGGHRRLSSVCLMLHTSALTRTPKGLRRRNFAQGYPRSHATPTPTSRSTGQKSRWGGGILWRRPSRTACYLYKPSLPRWLVKLVKCPSVHACLSIRAVLMFSER